MKKALLVFPMFLAMAVFAQQIKHANSAKDTKWQKLKAEGNQITSVNSAQSVALPTLGNQEISDRASVVNSIQIGSSGNLFTVLNGNLNQLYYEPATNSLIFIHRSDQTVFTNDNLGQYRYDISTDGGNTWTTNLGTFTPTQENSSLNGRFPEAVIYNPAGNTDPANQYMVYSGTWHDGSNGSWEGHLRGVVKTMIPFNIDSSSEENATINGGNVLVGSGMCRSTANTFWKANMASGSSFGTNDQLVYGITIDKGVWNETTKNVDWTTQVLNAPFILNSTGDQNIVTAINVAFDPTGTHGWIGMLGDINNDANSTYEPIFYYSPDSGNHWFGPTQVALGTLPGLIAELGDSIVDGSSAASGIPTTAFDADLVVDAWGNPHLITVVGNGGDYSIEAATYDVYDITSYNGSQNLGCGWAAIHLADINTLRGTFSSDNPATTEDNRPQASTTPDGTKIFAFWNESDIDVTLSPDNDIPNFFGASLDLSTNTMTAPKNFTEGDTLWGGETVNSLGGARSGATFPQVSPVSKSTGTLHTVPTVFTEVDYNQGTPLGSDAEPCRFFYISNIEFAAAEYTMPLVVDDTSNLVPSIALNGADTIVLLQNTPFNDPGADARVCGIGNITVTVNNGGLNTAVVGTYTITYTATYNGNTVTETRVVIIGAAPVADFSYTVLTADYRFQFIDQSINTPTTWAWTFGDNSGSNQQNPIKTYTAQNVGPRQVCLVASNAFGSSAQYCETINVIIGINDPEFSNTVSVFPNPTTDKLNIEFESSNSADYTVSLFNILSQEVIPANKFNLNGSKTLTLDLSKVSSGLYFVKIVNDGKTAIKEVVVE